MPKDGSMTQFDPCTTTTEAPTATSDFRSSSSAGQTEDVRADEAVLERTDAALDQIEQLSDRLDEHLDEQTGDDAPVIDFALPEGFLLSIVVPVYNEESTIHQVIDRLRSLPLPKEIVVVDDASTDGTREVLRSLERMPDVHVIYKPSNEGKGAALRTGFEYVTGDLVVVQDADLEYNPGEIPPLLKPILEGRSDVVYGSRFLEKRHRGSSGVHRLGNRMLTVASNLLTGLRLTDMETCYKVMRRDVVDALHIQQNRFGFEPEVTAKLARLQYRITELPVSYHARSFAEGKKIGLRDAANALYCIVRYAWTD
jgi:glycosyltransferase involved in cell wall biosynthesis